MPKFACQCGNILNLSGVWPECEWRLVPMKHIAKIADDLYEGKTPSGDEFYELIDKVSIEVYRCSVCGSLHLEKEDGIFYAYNPRLP